MPPGRCERILFSGQLDGLGNVYSSLVRRAFRRVEVRPVPLEYEPPDDRLDVYYKRLRNPKTGVTSLDYHTILSYPP